MVKNEVASDDPSTSSSVRGMKLCRSILSSQYDSVLTGFSFLAVKVTRFGIPHERTSRTSSEFQDPWSSERYNW